MGDCPGPTSPTRCSNGRAGRTNAVTLPSASLLQGFNTGPGEQFVLLHRSPLSSRGARAAGLTLLNLSLDTLQPAKFEAMTRRPGLQRVLGSLQQALDLGFAPVKVGFSCSLVFHSRCRSKMKMIVKILIRLDVGVREAAWGLHGQNDTCSSDGEGWSMAQQLSTPC